MKVVGGDNDGKFDVLDRTQNSQKNVPCKEIKYSVIFSRLMSKPATSASQILSCVGRHLLQQLQLYRNTLPYTGKIELQVKIEDKCK